MHEHCDPDRCLPYPELVEAIRRERPYRIFDSRGRSWLPSTGVTDKVARVLYVPLSRDGLAICRHELGHVAWSPERLPRVRYEPLVLQAVEDARVNLGLERIGLPVRLDAEQLGHVRMLAARDHKADLLAGVVLRAVASLGTNADAPLLRDLDAVPAPLRALVLRQRECVRSGLERARRRAGGAVAPFPAARRLARRLARELAAYGLLDGRLRRAELGCCLARVPAVEEGRRSRRGRPPGRGALPLAVDGAEPGRMQIATAPLVAPHPAPARGAGRRWRPASEGARLMRPDRLPIDGAIFQRPARARGGTVLVDTSGSMQLGSVDVDRLLDASRGAACVAIYSGRETEGELRIVARAGRRASAEHLEPFGSGNVVDLPALEWLARQPGLRVWVSDGRVTGVHDSATQQLRWRCHALERRARIRRVASAKAAAEVLAGRGGA